MFTWKRTGIWKREIINTVISLKYFLSSSVSSVTQSCSTLCDPMDCSMPGFPVHHQLSKLVQLMPIESVMPSNHLILCHPLLLLPSIFPSIRVFSNESVLCIRWSKYWSFSFSISPSNEYSGITDTKLCLLNQSFTFFKLASFRHSLSIFCVFFQDAFPHQSLFASPTKYLIYLLLSLITLIFLFSLIEIQSTVKKSYLLTTFLFQKFN